MNLHGKRLLICEEALKDFKGHYYSWIKAIRRVNQDAGAEVWVAGNQLVEQKIREELNVIPAYAVNSWSGVYHHPSAWRRYLNVFRHNIRLLSENRALFRKTGRVDCVVLTAVRVYHLIAWYFLCKWYLGKKFDRVVFFVLTSEAVYDERHEAFGFKKSSALIRMIIRGFRKRVADGSVVFAGDSHITCNEYEVLTGVPFRVFPSPGAGLISRRVVEKPHRQYPQFVFLGVSVIDKGIDLLQKAILQLLQAYPDLKASFVIQWGVRTIDYEGKEVLISPLLRAASQVTILENVLSDEDYNNYLSQADVVVLPYRRLEYFNKISGVAIEAALAGVPMIVTENTWLSWAMNEYGVGLTVKDGDVEDLAEKILVFMEQWPQLEAAAKDKKREALEKNSSEKYLQQMWL